MPVDFTLMSDGWCVQWEWIAFRGGAFRRIRFASMFALIQHPRLGNILFDTGYTRRFFAETQSFPERLYRLVTPVNVDPNVDAVSQLRSRGIAAHEVEHIVISHFHADHIGGLKDFPQARFHCTRASYESVTRLGRWQSVQRAFLPGLLPVDFKKRVLFAEEGAKMRLAECYAPFDEAYDLLGDGSVLGVNLPGHATGQMGVFLTSSNGTNHLLAADACWASRQFRENLMPHLIVRQLIDWSTYRSTLQKLCQLHKNNPGLRIIPSHCAEIWRT